MTSLRRGRASIGVLVALLALAGCRGADPGLPPQAASPAPTAIGAPSEPSSADPDVAATVKTILESARHPELTWPDIPDVGPLLRSSTRPNRTASSGSRADGPIPTVTAGVVKGLALADEQGLDRADYDADRLAERWKALRSDASDARPARPLRPGADRVRGAPHVGGSRGPRGPRHAELGIRGRAEAARPRRATCATPPGGDLGHVLAAHEPPFTHYARARRTLARYRAAAGRRAGARARRWPRDGRRSSRGRPGRACRELAARLRAFGDLRARRPRRRPVYEGPLVDAVKRFQRRHGLEADGVIGAGTIATLNVTLARRVRQIELAMERMRWLPADERPAHGLRERPALPPVGHRSHRPARSRCG